MKHLEKPKDKQVLQSTFHFDLDDLNANREGRISDAQKARLWRGAQKTLLLMSGVLLIIPGLLILGIIGLTETLVFTFFLLSVSWAFWWFSSRRETYKDVSEEQVAFAEGTIQIKVRGGSQNANTSTVLIDDQAFSVLTKDALAFKNYEPYRVYYAPHTKTILSAEWLREFDNNLIADDAAETDMPAESPPKHKRIN